MAKRGPILVMIALVAIAGCGTTNIYTTEPGARIVADGRSLGRGQGTLTRRGFPGSTNVVVKAEDGRQGQAVVRREFTALTLVMGLFTYGVCLIACWEYPDSVLVALPPAPGPGGSVAVPGAAPAVDPWLVPPAGWQPPAGETP